jgi:ABC-2 type transport system permease protein
MWSMLNPALYLVVFYIVFQLILGSGIPNYPIFMLSGLLVWNLFSAGLGGSTKSVVGNAGLVRKVSFSREILPLASVGGALVHFFLQGIVLVGALAIFRYDIAFSYLPLLPVALIALLMFTAAVGVLAAAMNVRMRDVEHFVELALLAWFWLTPIVYPFMLVTAKFSTFGRYLYELNPITWIVITFQRALYAQVQTTDAAGTVTELLPPNANQWWYLWHLLAIIGASAVLFLVALSFFGRVEGNFAEEL